MQVCYKHVPASSSEWASSPSHTSQQQCDTLDTMWPPPDRCE